MKDSVFKMAEWYKALSDPTRLRLIRLLASNPERSLCVGALAEKLGITQPAVSQHLKVLKSLDVVTPNRDGARVHYTIDTNMLRFYKAKSDEMFRSVFEQCSCLENECQKPDENCHGTQSQE